MAKKAALGTFSFGDTPAAVGELRSWNAPSEANEIDVTVMGTGNSAFIPGSIRQRVEVEVFFEFADAGQALALAQLGNDTPQAIELRPQGAGSGLPELTGNCTVMSYSPQGEASGAIEMSMVFESDSAGLTWAAQV